MVICFEFKEFAEFIAFFPQTLATFEKKIRVVLENFEIEKKEYENLFDDNEEKQWNLIHNIIKFEQIIKIFKNVDFRALVRSIKGERIKSKR